MFTRLSALVLTTAVLSFSAPAFAQTTFSNTAPVQTASAVTSPIDYSTYDTIIKKVAVNEGGRPRLAYDFIRKQNNDFVGQYVSQLARQDVGTLPKNDQLAYWLNVQNIVTIDAILKDGKRKKSLKKLRGTAEAPGPLWTKPRVTIAGQNMSLQDIETKLLTEFDNPNIIYGIYQGVRGGPSLTPTAYRGASVDEMLEKNAKRYVNSKAIVSVRNNVVEVTPVFFWYQDNTFQGEDGALLEHLKAYAHPNLKSELYRGKSSKTSSLNYRLDNYNIEKAARQQAGNSRSYSGGSQGVTQRGYGS